MDGGRIARRRRCADPARPGTGHPGRLPPRRATVNLLPDVAAWNAAAARHNELFAALTPGARVGLVAREAPASMLLWEAGDAGVQARTAPFPGFFDSGADI